MDSPLPGFEPRTHHGSQYEADGIQMCYPALVIFIKYYLFMSRKGSEVGQGILDFAEDLRYDVVSH